MIDGFEWRGSRLRYCRDSYNDSGRNERAVEIPIARQFIRRAAGIGLEVGNVLAHYGCRRGRVIIDRYEHADQVVNRDVFAVRGMFDWIVSVSTLEHVRWDEPPRILEGAHAAIEHLAGRLRPGGRMLITIPTGVHPDLDDRIRSGRMGADYACTFVRDGVDAWRPTPTPVVLPYGQPWWASAVWIGEWVR